MKKLKKLNAGKFNNYKAVSMVLCFSFSIAMFVLYPLHAQEDLSPAEQEAPSDETESGDKSGTAGQGEAGISLGLEPILWKNDNSGQLYANSAVKFILDSKDNLSQTDYVEYKINDSKFVRYIGPIVINEEGPHSITYRAIDRAGNREFNRNFNVVIDNTPPQVELTPAKAFVARGNQLYTSLGNTFTIRAVDQFSGIKSVKYGINNPASEDYEEGRTVQLSVPGNQVIQYNATDNLGNNTDGGNVLVYVDDKAPVINIKPSSPLRRIDGKNYARRATGFSIVSNDEGSGVSLIMVRIDGSKEWQTYNKPLYFATEQEHSIEARALDAVGNSSTVVSTTFIVDDNPPISELRTSVSNDDAGADDDTSK